MIIRKQFKFEGAHIVRNCSSDRCKKSIHGHSYIVEVFLESSKLDHGGMVMDFGLLKGSVSDLVDSFDHAYSVWSKENEDFRGFIQENSDRYVIMPVSPSAENYALMLAYLIHRIIEHTVFKNGEGDVHLKSVRVHETATGYAEATMQDVETMWNHYSNEIYFSESIKNEWKDPMMHAKIIKGESFQNPDVEVTHG